MKLVASLLLLVALFGRVSAAPGDLDTTFGNGGKVTTAVGATGDGMSVAVQGDGKIVVAGWTWPLTGSYIGDFALVRYNANGTPDTSFNGTGKVTTDIGSNSKEEGWSVAVQGDGKIVVAGWSDNGSGGDFALVRYNANGTLDRSFNGTGKVTTDIGSGFDAARSVAVQGDGKIVVAGWSNGGSALVRYNANGTLDTSFNGTGKVITAIGDFGGFGDLSNSVAVQDDGKIVVAGQSYKGTNVDLDVDFAVVRYNTNGTLDTSFNGTGKVTTAIGSGYASGRSVAVQGDGKIVVAGWSGWSDNEQTGDYAVVRYNANGTLDTSFNGTGKVTTDIGSTDDSRYSVAVQGDGKIVVAGMSLHGNNSDFALVRYNASGTLDTSFNGTGKVTTDIDSGYDYGNSVAVQGDGKIVVAGHSNGGFAVVRYQGDSASTFTLSNLAPVCDTNPPPAPAVRLNWTASPLATSYDLYRNGALYKAGLTDRTFYNSLGLVEGQSYTYKVVARNPGGTRDSNTRTVAIPAGLCATFGTPRIDTIVPNPVIGSASRQTITLDGAFFDPNCTVHLTWTGKPDYVVPSSRVTRVSGNRLSMSITTTTTTDDWTAEVVNPNGARSGKKPFSVIGATHALQPTAVGFSPSTVTAGNTLTVNFTIKNNGTEASPATTAKVQLSSDSTITTSDVVLSPSSISVSALAVGESAPLTQAVTVPSSLRGIYYVAVTADAGGIWNDAANSARTATATNRVSIVGSVTGNPLRATVVNNPIPSGASTVEIKVTNIGTSTVTYQTSQATGSGWFTPLFDTTEPGILTSGAAATIRYLAPANQSSSPRTGTVVVVASSSLLEPVLVTFTQLAAQPASTFTLSISQIPNVTAGQLVTVEVRALNGSGVLVPESGFVTLSASNYSGSLSASSLSLTNGIGSLPVSFNRSGSGVKLRAVMGTMTANSNEFDVTDDQPGAATIVATVQTQQGAPVSQATVSYDYYVGRIHLLASGVTDQSGVARIQTFASEGKLSARSAANFSTEQHVVVVGGKEHQIPLELKSSKPPVLLVPGMMGSWDKSIAIARPQLPREFPTPRSRLTIYGKDHVSNWNTLKRAMEDSGYEVFEVPWDWRMKTTAIDERSGKSAWQQYLLPAIDEAKSITGKTQVQIVAHSMGGTLCKGYLVSGEYESRHDISHLAFVGTPQEGALPAYYLWFGGDTKMADGEDDDLYQKVAGLAYKNHPCRGVPDWDGLSKAERMAFFRTEIPSLEELVPIYPCLQSFGGDAGGLVISSPFTWQGVVNSPLYKLNQKVPPTIAKQTKILRLVSNSEWDTPNIAGIVPAPGSSQTTTCGISVTVYPHGQSVLKPATSRGDGTVPVASGWGWDWRSYDDTLWEGDFGKPHSSEPGNASVVAKIRDFFGPAAAARAPRNGTGTPPDKNVTAGIAGDALLLMVSPAGGTIGVDPSTGLALNNVPCGTAYGDGSYSLIELADTTPGTYTSRFKAAVGEVIEVSSSLLWQETPYAFQERWIGTGTACELRAVAPAAPGRPVYFDSGAAKVSGLQASPDSQGTMLSWETGGESVGSYNVFGQAFGASKFQLLGTATTDSFVASQPWVTGNGAGEVWEYAVSAVSADGRCGPASGGVTNQTVRRVSFRTPDSVAVAPATLQLQDTSTGGPASSWSWDFNNDGIPDSLERNPTTTFAEPGTYLVSLRVTYPDSLSIQSESKPVTVAPLSGVVSVNLGPVIERPGSGRWKLLSEPLWQESEAVVEGVIYGTHTLEFQSVSGWTAPASVALTFSPDTPYQIIDLRYTRVTETYDEWRTKVFGADAGNPSVSGEAADPDHDGSANLVEYATGSDPLTPQSGDVLAVQTIPGNPAGLSISFAHNLKARPGTELTLEESDLLTEWSPVQPLSRAETLTGEHVSRVSFTILQTQPRKFYRLVVSK